MKVLASGIATSNNLYRLVIQNLFLFNKDHLTDGPVMIGVKPFMLCIIYFTQIMYF